MEDTDGPTTNEHQLWVNLSALTEGNLSGVLPRLIREMLGAEFVPRPIFEDGFELTLPSDFEWRTKVYHRLLEKQRLSQLPMEEQIPEENIVLHEWNIVPPKQEKRFCLPEVRRLRKNRSDADQERKIWKVSDIAKAAALLLTPPQKIDFNDEQEMRRVYTLIYDVFRYKSVLNQALKDIAFFLLFPQFEKEQYRVWLLLYDMYHRGFKKREVRTQPIATKLFVTYHLTEIEQILWQQRVKLAAAIARLRIEKSALKLSDLLPAHLKDGKMSDQDTFPVTCWVNIRKTRNKQALCDELANKLGLTMIDSDLTPGPDHFKWDPHCPHFLVLHPSVRTKLAQSPLVRRHKLIVQSKAFCIGPATFGKIIADLQLTGSVIQTHVNSPRTVAYLATVLSQNENIKKLMAFSAGSRKREYENYFNELGMKNILIYAEKLIDLSPDSHCLEEVIAVFATPPNSYSAVTDPIDLVCSRGGDLTTLEILTESEETKQTRERVANILEEQRKTLRYAMSRPQIQFVLYETHSDLDVENVGMVEHARKEMNRIAKLHHASLQGKMRSVTPQQETTPVSAESKEINNNQRREKVDPIGDADFNKDESAIPPSQPQSSDTLKTEDEETIDEFQNVWVPDCDVFDSPSVPDLCPNLDKCTRLKTEGCYLALLQRKVVTNMDNKYMIQMAEARGLFGSAANPNKRSMKSSKAKKPQERPSSPTIKPKKKVKHIEVDRIATPTLSSIQHSRVSTGDSSMVCPKRCCREETSLPKKWWYETTRHLSNLRTSLSDSDISFKQREDDGKIVKKRKHSTVRDSNLSPNSSMGSSNEGSRKRKIVKSPNVERLSTPTYNSLIRNVPQECSKMKCDQCQKRNKT